MDSSLSNTLRYDVVTLGETMIRLTPPSMQRLEMATDAAVHIGGSESNTAVGLARLGLKVAWLSRLTRNPLGRLVVNAIGIHGVDTSLIRWTESDRIGLYFLEEAKAPRGSRVIYDRRGSAMANMRPSDLPVDLFQPNVARALHTTGITLGIGKPGADTAMHAIELAKRAGWLVGFDVNYRALLWDRETALSSCNRAMSLADIIFLPIRDARLFYAPDSSDAPAQTIIKTIVERYPQAVVVMTTGADGAWAAFRDTLVHHPAFKTETVERLGGGDAFSAGFLSKFVLNSNSSENGLYTCLRTGCAVAALKYTIPGDLPIIEPSEVDRLVSSHQDLSIRR